MPLSKGLYFDFADRLKSVSSGYASLNLIISVLEGTEKSEDLFAYDNLNKSPFVPEKGSKDFNKTTFRQV